MGAIALDSGQLSFDVVVDGKAVRWDADLIELKLTSEQLEAKHKLQEKDGLIQGTVPFFRELAAAFEQLGCPACNVSTACRIWGIVNDRFQRSCAHMREQLQQLDAS